MKNDLSCEVVQDLLPSYVDSLTCEVTNQSIEAHIKNCTNCSDILNRMKQPEILEQNLQKHDIDFLKKTRVKTRLQIIIVAIITMIAVIASVLINAFCIGKEIDNPDLIQVTTTVANNQIALKGNLTDPEKGIANVSFDNESGIVHITVLATKKSSFHKNHFYATYHCPTAISQIWLGDQILWDHGDNIAKDVAKLYQAKHPYIGSMPENEESALALGIQKDIGIYTNELQTKEEPYGWNIIAKQDYIEENRAKIETQMKYYATAFIAVIDNLNYVTYEYTVDGQKCQLTFTEQDADKLAGQSVKALAKTPRGLQEVMNMGNLSNE